MMTFCHETGVLFLQLRATTIVDSDEILPGVIVDFDEWENVVSIEWL